MVHIETAIAASKLVTLALGGTISLLAHRAYRRTGATALRALSVGFAVVTFGTLLAGVVDVATGLGLLTGVLVQSVVTAFGFGIITYSLFVE
jgi:hypothetical protein